VFYLLPTDISQTDAGASATITRGAVDYLAGGTLTANAATRFVYQNYTSATASALYAYTGIANVPTFTGTTGSKIYTLNNGTTSLFVYAISANGEDNFVPSIVAGDWVYIMSANRTVNYVSATLTTHTYQAFVNGKVSTVTVESSKDIFNGAVGLYQVTGYDTNGYVTIATAAGNTITPPSFNSNSDDGLAVTSTTLVADTLDITGGVIKYNVTIGGTATTIAKALASDAKIYFVDTTMEAATGVIVYEITGDQANALNSTGAKIDMVQTSATDTSISAVYIRDINA
jgi:hypothetical protein